MQLHEMNLWQVMIFRLYILYNKHKMIRIGTQNREISQVLSQVLEDFFCRLYMVMFCQLRATSQGPPVSNSKLYCLGYHGPSIILTIFITIIINLIQSMFLFHLFHDQYIQIYVCICINIYFI